MRPLLARVMDAWSVPCALVFAADMIAGLADGPELKNRRRNEMVGNW